MKEFRKILGLFVFVSLMLVKVSALHVYSHQDNDQEKIENCKICDVILESQDAEANQIVNFENSPPSFPTVQIDNFNSVDLNIKKDLSYYLFSRPPPSYTI